MSFHKDQKSKELMAATEEGERSALPELELNETCGKDIANTLHGFQAKESNKAEEKNLNSHKTNSS